MATSPPSPSRGRGAGAAAAAIAATTGTPRQTPRLPRKPPRGSPAPPRRWCRPATAALQAAFFDLDKTVIAKASMVAFGRPFYHGGLINRRTVLRALYGELVYLHLGASEQKLNQIRESVLRLIKGWHSDRVREIVAEAIEEIVEPIIFAEAADLIDLHQAEGRLVVIVSASPEEIVAPLSSFLGADECIASRARVDEEGRYTGKMQFYAFGPFKAEAMDALAASARPRPGGVVRVHRLLHRPADAAGRRSPGRRQPGPGAQPLRARARLRDPALQPDREPLEPGTGPDRGRAAPPGHRRLGGRGRPRSRSGGRWLVVGLAQTRQLTSRPSPGRQSPRRRFAATTPRATSSASITSFLIMGAIVASLGLSRVRHCRADLSGRARPGGSDGEQVAGAGVARGVPQLGHRPRLDLADPLTGEVEVLADLFQGARLAAVEAEAELQDLALALVERRQQPVDLERQEGGGGHLEGRLGRAVLDDVAELGVAVLPQRLGERERLGPEPERLDELVLGQLDLDAELGRASPAARA